MQVTFPGSNGESSKKKNKEKRLLPEGTYPCKVLNATVKTPKSMGPDYWLLTLEVQEGEYNGVLFFDALFFTPKALKRTALVIEKLTGMKLQGDVDIEPEILLDCKANVEVTEVIEEYNGNTTTKNKVAYNGYSPYTGEVKDNIPF